MPSTRQAGSAAATRDVEVERAPEAASAAPRCVLNARVSGAFVEDARGALRVDFACVCAVDGLVPPATREALFQRVGGDETAPSERVWTENFKDHDGEYASRTHGLRDFMLDELATEAYEGVGAMGDVMRRVRDTFPEYDVVVARTDLFQSEEHRREDDNMDNVPPQARRAHVCANAARHTDRFSYHRDVDVRGVDFGGGELAKFGRFCANRDANKPRFVTIIVYLNPKWDIDDEGETLFVDETGVGVVVIPKPGRVVFMDADVFHSLKPTRRKVRYSLVVHALFTARADAGVTNTEIARPEWGTPTHVGSAARLHDLVKAASRKRGVDDS